MGASAVRLFLLGYGVAAIGAKLEQRCVGAELRWHRLVEALQEREAFVCQPPTRTAHWWARRAAAIALGHLLSQLTGVLAHLPLWALRRLYHTLPATPLATRTLAHLCPSIEANLCAAGYADRPDAWRRHMARLVSEATIRTHIMSYLMLVLPMHKLNRFIQSVTAIRGLEHLAQAAEAKHGAIVVGLHWELFLAPVFYARRLRPVSLLANVALADYSVASSRRLAAIPFVQAVDSAAPMAAKTLADRLRAGQIVLLAFDVVPAAGADRTKMKGISFLGQSIPRFDTAAWLAVHTGKPVLMVSTRREGNRLAVELSAPLPPLETLSPQEQVTRMTEQIYAAGEQLVRRTPESWLAWSTLHNMEVSSI
jgi:lauroyl/myristoyl acyltransferase